MPANDPVEAWIERGEAALDEGDFEAALASFDRALKADPEHWGATLGRIECLHLLWRTQEGLREIRTLRDSLEEEDPDRAELEARILEASGAFEDADRLLAEAHRIDPGEFPLPVRTTEEDFRAILDKVLDSLPGVIREVVAVIPVLVEAKPKRAIAERAPHVTPDILGLFVGVSVGNAVFAASGYGNVVLLFQRNLERAGRSRSEVAREIKTTLLHEYGHYLGFDEEELEHLGLG